MMRIGLCGFGGLGHVHANALCRLPDVKIVAVCDIHPERLAAAEVATNLPGAPASFDIRSAATYTDFRTLLKRERPDVVVTALPTDIHAEYAILAMKAGCHVFSEKPMALTVAECDRMIRARDRYRRELMIGQCLRFWPEYEALLKAMRSGEYGRLRSLSMERLGNYGNWGADNWFNDHHRSGGAILDLHLHDVDWAIHALGRPASIFAAGQVGQSGGIDDVTAVWTYANGPTVTMRSTWMYQGFTMNFRALFERGVLQFGIPPNAALCRKVGADITALPLDGNGENGYAREIRYFLDCAAGRQTNTQCPGESTRESVQMVYEEHRSIRTGRVVRL
jgi:predicted dehydrogenase